MTNETKGRASYDPDADAIGVYFAPEGAEYDGSDEVAPGVVLDYDKQGRVIGVELLHVRKLLAQGSLADVNKAAKPAA
jgi:uncharacterized protein YuzE